MILKLIRWLFVCIFNLVLPDLCLSTGLVAVSLRLALTLDVKERVVHVNFKSVFAVDNWSVSVITELTGWTSLS